MSAIGEIANFLIGGMTAGLNFSGTKKTNQTNLDIARETNQANLDIARETNAANIQMNQENNQLQQDLADKAYQRSTASNQIAELIKAGYTQQQAMMAVLGNGDSAAMPMPTTAAGHADSAVMQPATMIPPDFSAMGQPFGGNDEFLGALANSLNAPDGGVIGWGIAQDYITGLMNFVDDGILPPDKVSSPADLLEYIKTLEDGDNKNKLTSFLDSDASKKVKRFVPAQRAVFSFMQQNMGFKAENQRINESYQRIVESQKRVLLMKEEINLTNIQAAREELSYMKQNELFDSELELGFATLRNTILEADRTYEINSRGYKQFVSNALKDLSVQAAVLEVLRLRNAYEEQQVLAATGALSKDMQLIFGYYKVFQDCGLLNATLWGGISSTLGSVSAEFVSEIESLIEKINNRISNEDNPLAHYSLDGRI